jgi:hypothetical protein
MTDGCSEAADQCGYKLAASMTVDGRLQPVDIEQAVTQ